MWKTTTLITKSGSSKEKSQQMVPLPFAETQKQMTFWDHLGDLRAVLIRSILGVVVTSIISFI